MKTTTQDYKKAIQQDTRHFKTKLYIDGIELCLKSLKLTSAVNSSDTISLGDAVSAYIEAVIINPSILLLGKELNPQIGLRVQDGTYEYVSLGIFKVTEATKDGKNIKIKASDRMALTEKGFFTSKTGIVQVKDILQEQAQKLGFSFVSDVGNLAVDVDKLEGFTIREVIATLAGYCGGNARFNHNGDLEFLFYSNHDVTITSSRFSDPLNIEEEDTIVRGIKCTIDSNTVMQVGNGLGIDFSCTVMTQDRLNTIFKSVENFSYRGCEIKLNLGQPELDPGDIITVKDINNILYRVPIMELVTEFDGGVKQTIKAKATSTAKREIEYKGPLTKKTEKLIADIVQTKKIVADTIEAFNGEFDHINTNILNVSQQLTATSGKVEHLESTIAEIDTTITNELIAIDARITNIEAIDINTVKADIEHAKIGIADINTLLSGSVSTGSTQTIVLNADNTTIANALIKSAMIDSVVADKITAGTIDASSIHFQSKSGRLDIYGETLQIRDTNRVRVQIGKDGTDDYSLSQWDAQGNLMWDSRGAKAAAIKDKIIVNDMVADNAGIEGKKINITSLVKEINDGTEIIKSSHILVDGPNQSLSVVYNTITGDINTLSTALSVEQGKISSLITDVSQTKGDVSTLKTNYSSLTQTVSGINSTVSSHTSSIENLNNMEIGGRNLLLNSGFLYGLEGIRERGDIYTFIKEAELFNGNYSLKITGTDISVSGTKDINHTVATLPNAGDNLMISFYVKGSLNTTGWIRVGGGRIAGSGPKLFEITTEWSKVIIDLGKVRNSSGETYAIYGFNDVGTFWINSMMLEVGNKNTPWSPNPKDVNDSIKTVTDKTTTLEQTVDGFSARITSAEKDATSAINKATTLETTVNGFDARISCATSKADEAIGKTTEISASVEGLSISVESKVGKDIVISAINQSAEAIQIQASKINLTGQVTLSMLATDTSDALDNAMVLAKAMAEGRMINTDPTFIRGNGGLNVYNNTANGAVTLARGNSSTYLPDCPSPYYLEIKNNGAGSTPGWGGFYLGNGTAANHVYVYKIIAKIPVGYSINWAANGYGNGSSLTWMTDRDGTGQFKEYICIARAGSSGTFSSIGFFYTSGKTVPATWWVGYFGAWDLNKEPLTYEWTNGTTKINGSYIQTGTITADHIASKTLYGVTITGGTITSNTTINVTTNLTVGNNIYVGSYTDRDTKKYVYLNDRFGLFSRNDAVVFGRVSSTFFDIGTLTIMSSGSAYLKGANYVRLGCGNSSVFLADDSVMINDRDVTTVRTSGNWRMYILPNGMKIATYYTTMSSGNFGLWGNTYESSNYIQTSVPSFFSRIEWYDGKFEGTPGLWTENQESMTTAKTPRFYACRGTASPVYSLTFKLVIVGG